MWFGGGAGRVGGVALVAGSGGVCGRGREGETVSVLVLFGERAG